MNWLWPVGLIALLAIPLIVILHALRPRHRSLPVSSLMLWLDASASPRSRRRWRRPRPTLLLLAQLAVAALVAFAIARPATDEERGRHLAIVIDGSRVMKAADVAPTRFEAARSQAADALRGLGPADAATVVFAHDLPFAAVQATAPGAALAALSGIGTDPRVGPGDAPADFAAALEVAGAAIRSAPARSNELLVLTGSSLETVRLADLPARVTVRTIGSGGPNVGLAAFDARQLPGVAASRAYARVTNYGDLPASPTVSLIGDGVTLERRRIQLAARAEQALSFTVPAGVRSVAARVDPAAGGADLFPADDRAEAGVGGTVRDITFVGSASDPVYRALGVLPGVSVQVVAPEGYRPADRPAPREVLADQAPRALTVFSGWLPSQPPSGPALIVAPPAGSTWLAVAQQTAAGRLVRQDAESPLLRGVDLSSVNFGPIRPAPLPEWASSSVDAAEGPIVYQGVLNGHRLAVLAFNPNRSNLTKQPSFPLLLANSLDWLTPVAGSAGTPPDPFLRARESDLRIPELPPIPAPVDLPAPGRLIDATWWQWLVLAAFLLLLFEWWRYGREVR